MPIKTFQNSFRYPHNLVLRDFSEDPRNNSANVAKLLPYVDVQTGIKNRVLARDPITGLGDLSPELDVLKGSNIQRKIEMVQRNPILLDGHTEEYDCLYTTKHVIPKQRIIRDPITLNGDLGEELDHLRPHGGRSRNKATNKDPKRDPIAGVGDFGREWDPIYKYDGRPNLHRPVQAKTDPITHSTHPEANSAREMRHFPEKQGGLDVIGHTDINVAVEKGRGRKIFPEKVQRTDHLSHDCTITWKTKDGGTQPAEVNTKDSIQCNRNPITHLNCVYAIATTGLRLELCPEEPLPLRTARRPLNSEFTRHRNPITGVGMREEDYFTAINVPLGFWIRGTSTCKPKTRKPTKTEYAKAIRPAKKPAAETKS
ncbi:hypothetical protein AAHC03_0873 [Spirometra sp. Aus1]